MAELLLRSGRNSNFIRQFSASLLVGQVLIENQAMNPFRTGKLVLFQVTYDRDWHFFEIMFFIIIGIFGVRSFNFDYTTGRTLITLPIGPIRCLSDQVPSASFSLSQEVPWESWDSGGDDARNTDSDSRLLQSVLAHRYDRKSRAALSRMRSYRKRGQYLPVSYLRHRFYDSVH